MYGASSYPARFRHNSIPLGPLTHLTPNESPRHRSNPITHSKLRFPDPVNHELNDNESENFNSAPKAEVETFSETEIQMHPVVNNTMNKLESNAIAARASNLIQQCATKIEMGSQSQVLVGPGTTGQIYFELTNLRREPLLHTVRVADERSYLLRLYPER